VGGAAGGAEAGAAKDGSMKCRAVREHKATNAEMFVTRNKSERSKGWKKGMSHRWSWRVTCTIESYEQR